MHIIIYYCACIHSLEVSPAAVAVHTMSPLNGNHQCHSQDEHSSTPITPQLDQDICMWQFPHTVIPNPLWLIVLLNSFILTSLAIYYCDWSCMHAYVVCMNKEEWEELNRKVYYSLANSYNDKTYMYTPWYLINNSVMIALTLLITMYREDNKVCTQSCDKIVHR